MTKQQRHKALMPVRLALKGWAFQDKVKWPRTIDHARNARDTLPASLHDEADALIADVESAMV